jgi:hypothetical protein
MHCIAPAHTHTQNGPQTVHCLYPDYRHSETIPTRQLAADRGGVMPRLMANESYCRAIFALGMKRLNISSNRGSKRLGRHASAAARQRCRSCAHVVLFSQIRARLAASGQRQS